MPQVIPTSLSARLWPFFAVLEDIGAPFITALENSPLPSAVLERGDIRYSSPVAYGFLDTIADREGVDDLAFRGTMAESVDTIEPPIRAHLLSACTLFVSLWRYMCVVARYNGRRPSLSVGASEARMFVPSNIEAARHSWNTYSEWSNIAFPLILCRQVAGAFWEPREITLQTRAPISDLVRETFPNTILLTGADVTSMTLPSKLLSWRMPSRSAYVGKPGAGADAPGLDDYEFSSFIKQLVAPCLGEGLLSLELAAEMANMSPRTFQRRLREAGASYSGIVRDAMFERATQLLAHPDAKIIEVGLEVGYEDPAHFARAFRAIAGVSPKQYRAQLL